MDIGNLIQGLIRDKGPELARTLSAQIGIDASVAERFVPVALEKLGAALSGGGFDLGSLLGGTDLSKLVEAAEPADIASQLGIETEKASEGLAALAPAVLEGLQGGGAAGLLGSLGGGGAGGLIGKLGGLFKK